MVRTTICADATPGADYPTYQIKPELYREDGKLKRQMEQCYERLAGVEQQLLEATAHVQRLERKLRHAEEHLQPPH